MKRQIKRDELLSRIFSLSDEGVEFRNTWRGIVGGVVWLLLSGLTMILTILGVTNRLHILVLIAMSFIKYVPLLMVVYALARKMASRYLDDVFELHDEDLASNFLEEVTFGYGREKITINEGKIPEKDERSPIILIGGPGEIQVNLDSVALLEKVNGEPEVIHPRKEEWKLGRFERIREIGKFDEVGKREYAIINLRDQFISGLSVKSRTKDGIPIEAQGIKVIFSILRRQATEEELANGEDASYLFEEKAVQSLVYGQTIITPEPAGQSGISFPWNTSVIPLITSEMEKMITSRTLSEILATISQKEVDLTSNNEATLAQMRLEMTGEQKTRAFGTDTNAPSFQSRSRITAQFFEDAFKEKAAAIGVSVQWIDVGTWQLPSPIILEKHKEALTLARENVSKRNAVERSKRKYETAEIVNLIDHVVISNFEKAGSGRGSGSWSREKDVSNKEILKQIEAIISKRPELKDQFFIDDEDGQDLEKDLASFRPEIRNQIAQQESSKKDAANTAREILKAFRKELINGKAMIEKESRPEAEKQADLNKINKALYDIEHLTFHYLK
ncbi:MAG: hypothetical protein JNM55_01400 [Anaerolineales bacterium]|nr:hypothetical protein [Anaerolineales bacterium]